MTRYGDDGYKSILCGLYKTQRRSTMNIYYRHSIKMFRIMSLLERRFVKSGKRSFKLSTSEWRYV